jgi:NAD(P)H-hydrate epimerase
MWLWTREEARRIDRRTLDSGVPETELMKRAGRKSAERILTLFPKIQSVVVLCGPGHNGEDGQIAARVLKAGLSPSASVTVFRFPEDAERFLQQDLRADLWIDALFGIGLNRRIENPYFKIIQKLNQCSGLKVAFDTPSGLDIDTGNPLGIAVQADVTLTIGHPKPGFYLNQGPRFAGVIHAIDLEFPKSIVTSEAHSTFLLSRRLVQRWLPIRQPTDHKSRGGSSLIWAGSRLMPGAATLAARAASRLGSGYVYVTCAQALQFHPEAILWKRSDYSRIRAALLGPGLGHDVKIKSYFQELRQTQIPVVIDADALTMAARLQLKPLPNHWVATPHAGELARLLDCSAEDIESDRLKYARLAQRQWGGVFVLKGYHTVVATSEVSVIIPTGNVALAKGGSGDVLGGMITSLMAQGLSPDRAALCACYVHGWIADQWLRDQKDHLSLTPSDLIEAIPRALYRIRRT